MSVIKVRWLAEAKRGCPRGELVEVPKGSLNKRVYVDSRFTGRNPAAGEETDAMVRWSNPQCIWVFPLYGAAPGDLSEAEAMNRLLLMAQAAGPVFGFEPVVIEVEDLPGWRGNLEGRRVRECRRESSPLAAVWYYESEAAQRVILISDPDLYRYVPITAGIIITRRGAVQIVNWRQAVADLGKPQQISPSPDGETADVVWRDRYGGTLQVRTSLQMIAAADSIEVSGIRVNSMGRVLGTVRLVEQDVTVCGAHLATDEWLDPRTMRIQPAHIAHTWPLPPDVRDQLAGLLRQRRHAPRWYAQDRLSTELDPSAEWDQALWPRIRVLEGYLEDPFCPFSYIKQALSDVREARTAIDAMQRQKVYPIPTGTGDPAIYQGDIPPDSADIERLESENKDMIARVDSKISELEAAVRAVPALRTSPDYRTQVWMDATEMLEHIDALGDRFRDPWIRGQIERVVRCSEATDPLIEDVLDLFREARLSYPDIIAAASALD